MKFSDFVTPLKKRRLARESLSLDSVTSESPTPNPSSTQPSRSYFMTESGGDDKQDSFKMKNGFKAFFSPLRPDSIEEDSALVCCCYFFLLVQIFQINSPRRAGP